MNLHLGKSVYFMMIYIYIFEVIQCLLLLTKGKESLNPHSSQNSWSCIGQAIFTDTCIPLCVTMEVMLI